MGRIMYKDIEYAGGGGGAKYGTVTNVYGSLSFTLVKSGNVALLTCTAGNAPTGTNTSIGTLPSGFIPITNVEIACSTGQRVILEAGSTTIKYVSKQQASAEGAGLRFTSMFIVV